MPYTRAGESAIVCIRTRTAASLGRMDATHAHQMPDPSAADRARAVNAAVASALRAEAAAQRITWPDLARLSGVPNSTISNYLNAKRDIPLPALYKMAAALEIDVPTLWTRAMDRMG